MSRFVAWQAARVIVTLGGVLLIAAVDFFSGVELRVFPLYYLPIAFAAWHLGRSGAAGAAGLSALGWFVSNQLAGLQYSHPVIWIANAFVQGASFALVGFLVAGLKQVITRERELSRLDPLCPLLNRRSFFDESARVLALCRRNGRPVTLAYIDLDNFKAANDRRGHRAGDDLLRTVAQQLLASVRSSDVSARLGGDEFALLLPEVGPEQARATLERLRDTICHSAPALDCGVTASVGAVTFMTAPDDLELMVQMADSVMYAAKSDGKNQVHLEVVGPGAGVRAVS